MAKSEVAIATTESNNLEDKKVPLLSKDFWKKWKGVEFLTNPEEAERIRKSLEELLQMKDKFLLILSWLKTIGRIGWTVIAAIAGSILWITASSIAQVYELNTTLKSQVAADEVKIETAKKDIDSLDERVRYLERNPKSIVETRTEYKQGILTWTTLEISAKWSWSTR